MAPGPETGMSMASGLERCDVPPQGLPRFSGCVHLSALSVSPASLPPPQGRAVSVLLTRG